jgi:tRNA threonylcarbamoyl adenosine modification protein (Sua5/YciO/YrdC/YwlC family)
LSSEALQQIFAIKGRPSDNPLIVHVASFEHFEQLVVEVPPVVRLLAARFWPGPLTIVLPYKPEAGISQLCTAGLSCVGIRVPDHPVALELIRQAGVPIAAPSANVSGRPSPTLAQHVVDDFSHDQRLAGVVDGGATGIGLESTVIDCCSFCSATAGSDSCSSSSSSSSSDSSPVITILRPGGITQQQLQAVVGADIRVEVDAALPTFASSSSLSSQSSSSTQLSSTATEPQPQKLLAPRAPGMKYRHYAPRARCHVVVGLQPAWWRELLGREAAVVADGEGSSSSSGSSSSGSGSASESPSSLSASASPVVEAEAAAAAAASGDSKSRQQRPRRIGVLASADRHALLQSMMTAIASDQAASAAAGADATNTSTRATLSISSAATSSATSSTTTFSSSEAVELVLLEFGRDAGDVQGQAATLYAALRRFDDAAVDVILIQSCSSGSGTGSGSSSQEKNDDDDTDVLDACGGLEQAVVNRLLKACSGRVLRPPVAGAARE